MSFMICFIIYIFILHQNNCTSNNSVANEEEKDIYYGSQIVGGPYQNMGHQFMSLGGQVVRWVSRQGSCWVVLRSTSDFHLSITVINIDLLYNGCYLRPSRLHC